MGSATGALPHGSDVAHYKAKCHNNSSNHYQIIQRMYLLRSKGKSALMCHRDDAILHAWIFKFLSRETNLCPLSLKFYLLWVIFQRIFLKLSCGKLDLFFCC